MCATALLGACGAGGADTPAALRARPPDLLGFSVHPRRPFTYGEAILYNRTREPVKLESLRLVDASPGLRLLQADALGPSRTFDGEHLISDSGGPGWPSPSWKRIRPLRPLRGHSVPSDHTNKGRRGVELWLKLQVPKNGAYRVRHFEVTYDVGGTTHSLVFPDTLLACAQRDLTKQCTLHAFQ